MSRTAPFTTPSNGANILFFNATLTGANTAFVAATASGAGFGDPLNSVNVSFGGNVYPNVPNAAHVDGNLSLVWQWVNSTGNAGFIN